MKRNAAQLYGGQTMRAQSARILIIAPSMDILGGQAVQAARLVARLRNDAVYEVGFLPINPRLPGALRLLQAIKYVRTIVTSFLYVATLFAQVRKYDIIHIFSASYFSFLLAPTPAILISKLFNKSVLLNYHSGEAADHLQRWPSAMRTIRLADRLVVPSEYLVRVFANYGLRAEAVNNLIELKDFRFRERKQLRPRFLTNRNLETHYGVDCVLRAFARIQKTVPDARLTVTGTGSQLAFLQSLAIQLGLKNLEFTGRVEPKNIFTQYDEADVYLNGSRVDNQPLSILEAFACGIPVVTTNAGGINDMVTDQVSGYVVQKDDYESMAAKALVALQKPHDTAQMTLRAFAECQKYTWRAVGEQWNVLYRSIATSHIPAAPLRRSIIRKIRRMSFAEARVRSAQLVKKIAERKGCSRSSRLPTDEQLLKRFRGGPTSKIKSVDQLSQYFRSVPRPYFFSAFSDPDYTTALLRRTWPAAEKDIVGTADRIISGKFDLLGWNGLNFGDPIDWSLEPVSGKVAPFTHWSTIDYLNPDVCGDKKIIWELNRHQYFVKLGQAYWLTQDEAYAQCFAKHVESWMDANPPKLGINWTSSLEVAFRSISWIWALHFFRNTTSLSSTTFARILKFLYLNARHLENYLSTYFSPNTHLTGEALGLFYLGTVLPEFTESKRWRATGTAILIDQLRHQVLPDGVYFERSSYYHRYTVDFYIHFLILSQASGQALPNVVEDKLKSLLDHLMYITRPDGTAPLFGDEDGGRLIKLDERATNDFRGCLSTGASLFNRGDYKFVAGEIAQETFWLLGPEGLKQFENTTAHCPSSTSRAFPDSGYYVMRDGWEPQSNYLLFDCGPQGGSNSAHAHADALGIQIASSGVSMLEDSGTYTYTGSITARNLFRGSAAHNVLLVDGKPSAVPDGPFSWKSTATSTPLAWLSEPRFDFVEGKHDGYAILDDAVSHVRSVLFLKNDYWILLDRLSALATHNVELLFHFAANVQAQMTVGDGNNEPHILAEAGSAAGSTLLATFGDGNWRREDGWVSHCYGRRTAAPVWTYSAVSKGDRDLVTFLLPEYGLRANAATVRQIEAIGGKGFEIRKGAHRDLILIKDAGARRIQTVHLTSDFKWTWARFPLTTTDLPEELLLLEGCTVELNGKEILMSAKPINYLTATRLGNKFRLQTRDGSLDFSFPIANLDSLFVRSSQLQS